MSKQNNTIFIKRGGSPPAGRFEEQRNMAGAWGMGPLTGVGFKPNTCG